MDFEDTASSDGHRIDWVSHEDDQGGQLSHDPDAAWEAIRSTQRFVDPPRTSGSGRKGKDCTRLVFLSDTHSRHRDIALPAGDVLIHAGDFTKTGELGTIADLSTYFGEIRSKYLQIICIAGNHDIVFEPSFYRSNWNRFHSKRIEDEGVLPPKLQHCTYLEDSSCRLGRGSNDVVDDDGGSGIVGTEVYGSPWTPDFYNWAFMKDRGRPLRDVWSRIPTGTDVLITHGPPLGRGDGTAFGNRAGCYDLLSEVQHRVQPRVHVFGHIHEGYGATYDGTTLFVNASNVDLKYHPVNPCFVVDLPHDTSKPAMLVDPECQLHVPNELQLWLSRNGYEALAERVQDAIDQNDDTTSSLPWSALLGNNLLQKSAYLNVAEKLRLHHEAKLQKSLQEALRRLHAQSFE